MKVFLNRHRHLTAVILLVLALAAIWFFESSEARSWRADLWEWVNYVHDILGEAPPLVYFTAAGLLPMLGIPIVSFYLLTASLYPPEIAILGTVYSVMLNLLLSYAIGRVGRKWITALIARSGRSIPQIAPRHHIWMTAAIRVAPGAPLMVQNYLLVLAGVPLSVFVLVSLPMEMLIATGYVLLGRSLFTGNWQMLCVAAGVVVVAVVVFRLVRRGSAKKEKALGLPDPAAALEPDSESPAADEAGNRIAGNTRNGSEIARTDSDKSDPAGQ